VTRIALAEARQRLRNFVDEMTSDPAPFEA